MEQDYGSILKFNKYVVNSVNFNTNSKFIKNEEKISINLNIEKEVIKNDDNMEVKLTTSIFKGAEDNNYPFEMKIIVTGYFTVINNESNINLEPNAIAILYPYIRAIVSTYTSIANTMPLILPAINVNKLIDEQKKD